MSTVDRTTAEKIAGGAYKSDRPLKIWKYWNIFDGAEAFGVIMGWDDPTWTSRVATKRQPVLWWTAEGGRTEEA